MNDLKNEALKGALIALEKEVKAEPISPERVMALSEAIKVLCGIKPLGQL